MAFLDRFDHVCRIYNPTLDIKAFNKFHPKTLQRQASENMSCQFPLGNVPYIACQHGLQDKGIKITRVICGQHIRQLLRQVL